MVHEESLIDRSTNDRRCIGRRCGRPHEGQKYPLWLTQGFKKNILHVFVPFNQLLCSLDRIPICPILMGTSENALFAPSLGAHFQNSLRDNMYMHNPSLRMVPVHEPHSFPATLDRDDSAVFYQELWTTLFHVLGKRQLFCIAIDVWSSCSTPIPETSQDPMSSSKTGKKPPYSGGQESPLRQDATIGMKMLQQTDPEGSGVAGASNPVKTHRGQWPA